jgi:nitrogen fixation NifU-like protein
MSGPRDSFGDLDELYQQVILDHSRNPRNFHPLANADAKAEGYNALCGDRVTVEIKRDPAHPELVGDVAFTGKGCAICTSSASMMTQAVKGKPRDQVEKMFTRFHEMLTAKTGEPDEETLDKLVVFAGVKKYPVRVKCATLPWHTLKAAMEHKDEKVSTE